MDIQINQVVSVVSSVDGDSLLSEGVLRRIVQGVLNGIAEEERNRKRSEGDRSLRGGRGHHAERTAPDEAWPGARVKSVSITIYPESDDGDSGSKPNRDRAKKKR